MPRRRAADKSSTGFGLYSSVTRRLHPLDPTRVGQAEALNWVYRVGNRTRWTGDTRSEQERREQASRFLEGIGLGSEDLAQMVAGSEPVIEVTIPYIDEPLDWELRILPWEYLLRSAASPQRGQRLLVIRHLDSGGRRPPGRPPGSMLIAVAAPEGIADRYSFDTELDVVASSLSPPTEPQPDGDSDLGNGIELLPPLHNPTAGQLQQEITRQRPDVIHITGADTHQGARILGWPHDPNRLDGLIMAGPGGTDEVATESVAGILNAGSRKPRLVTFSTYHSGARVAALTVAGGALSAIGIQDEMDDTLVELFYAAFYRAWTLSGYRTLHAFQVALQTVQEHPLPMRGSGLVLWSRVSLLKGRPSAAAAGTDEIRQRMQEESAGPAQPTRTTGTGAGSVRPMLGVEILPHESLNYALLHNDQNLFKSFKLYKRASGTLRDIRIDVTVAVGADQFHYRSSLDLHEPLTELTDQVRVSLTWDLLRTLRETVRISVFVEVSYSGQVIERDTYSLKLVPADEWLDTPALNLWLPSFVLPRDAAVERIVDRAQGYLMALRDDPGCGFDGYQMADYAGQDFTSVDLQARALWSALLYDFRLSYIEPPPSARDTQRLRSPSAVIDGGRGTCIDLALLLASCLEFIGIYPVVFLLQGHAFAGYWRHTAAHAEFTAVAHSGVGTPDGNAPAPVRQRRAWMLGAGAFDEIGAQLQAERLVPLETTLLTSHGGFGEAYDTAFGYLQDSGTFDALVDIQRARDAGVTALPLRGPKS